MSNWYFWYNLIELARKSDIIIDGLTIPFIIGAKKQLDPDFIIADNSIGELLTEIVNAEVEEKAVLKYSPNNQYIISLRDARFCKENLSAELIFKNKKGNNTLYVTKDISIFGNTIQKISSSLHEVYKNQIEKENFSWDERARRWQKFNDTEKNIIIESTK
jgi:hypothetical protein